MSANSLNTLQLHHLQRDTIHPHTLSAQVQTLQALVDHLQTKLSIQERTIDQHTDLMDKLRQNHKTVCVDLLQTTKQMTALSERCTQSEEKLERLEKEVRFLVLQWFGDLENKANRRNWSVEKRRGIDTELHHFFR